MPFRPANRIIVSYLLFATAQVLTTASAQEWENHPALPPSKGVLWQSADAEHAYGLPDTKPKRRGTLTLDQQNLTFTHKTSTTSIPRRSISAVSSGNERIELWGTGGRILRMAIPEGGGLAAAAVMHHRVDMLTVQFSDTQGGVHSAVFYLPANEADKALKSFGALRAAPMEPNNIATCGDRPIDSRSVLVEIPNWERADVPAAYRALVYEHVIDRLKTTRGAGHIYRAGETEHGAVCPRFTIEIAMEAYTKGNQVVRASTGPIGMFTSATKMTFNVTYTDSLVKVTRTQQIKAAVRTESESTGVADAVAKKLAKQYRSILKASSAEPAHPHS